MGGQRDFHEAAFYVTRRMRAEWANEETEVLVERLRFMHKAPRLVLTWGTWRKPRKCLARKVPPPRQLGSP
jgi:DTW domain-containing protein YfiP